MIALLKQDAQVERTFTPEQSRMNAARELHKWGPRHKASAEAMEVVLEDDQDSAAWVAKTLTGLINSRVLKLESWMLEAVCLQQNQAAAMVRDEEELAMNFIAPLIIVWMTLVKADRISESDLLELEIILARKVRPANRWANWAKKALERCIRASHPELFDVLVDLADEVKKGLAEHRGATVLIDGLLSRVPGLIDRHRQENARQKAANEAARRARQLARADSFKDKKSKK